jgi:deoxycytidylate deaminase
MKGYAALNYFFHTFLLYSVVKQKETEINKILYSIRELYPKARGLQALRHVLKRKNLPPEAIDKTAQILRQLIILSKDIKTVFKEDNEDTYRTLMQDFGDNIRRCGNPFNYDNKKTPYKKNNHEKWCRDIKDIIDFLYFNRGYSFFILDSFRNPYEVLYFQELYTDFYLISVNASESSRRKRREFNVINEERDQGKKVRTEEIFFKQHVPRTVKLSDIAISNDDTISNKTERQNKLIKKISRYLSLIFDAGCTKPKDNEIMMNLAYTTAMKSNCISRQVGAVIEGRDGYVIGVGWNDVGEGQVSCGLREIKDLESGAYDEYIRVFLDKDEHDDISDKDRQNVVDMLMRDYINKKIETDDIKRFCFCFKDEFSIKKLNDKAKGVDAECADKIEKIGIKRLEYCQALHAEENAIIQGAKIGGMGLQGAKIYTTAFPCELCAKKIQQVGIDRVVYTEPYPGNISEHIYLKSHLKKIITEQFEGVMPRGYFKLFKVTEDQKEWQELRCREFVD